MANIKRDDFARAAFEQHLSEAASGRANIESKGSCGRNAEGIEGGNEQASKAAAAATTLDVCHDTETGNWRYSGIVAVMGTALKDSSVVSIDYHIENQLSAQGYRDALRAPAVTDGAVLPTTSGARLARFSVDAAPLSLGSLRNTAKISIADPLAPASPPFSLASSEVFAAAVCGCQVPKGCTRTQGYWGNKPGVLWRTPYARENMFFSSGLSWQSLFDTAPRGGNAYVILAHQYQAALLNIAAGASAPPGIQTVLANARTFFNSGATLASCGASACATQKSWAGILDTYNNGQYPGAPKHCTD